MSTRSWSVLLVLPSLVGCFHFRSASQSRVSSTQLYSALDRRAEKIANLSSWGEKVGIKRNAVTVKPMGSSGLGVVSTKDADAGSVLMTVPTSVALTVESGSGPDDYSVFDLFSDNRTFRSFPWYVQFSLYLFKLDKIDSRKGSSGDLDLRPWLASLPRKFDTPIHWSSATIQDLQYEHLTEMVDRQKTSWKAYYDETCAILNSSKPSWNDFLWGCESARSRAFSGGFTGKAFNPAVYIFTFFLVIGYVALGLGTVEQAANGAALVVCASILRDFVVPKLLKTKKYVICPVIDMCNHQSLQTTAQVAFEFFIDAYSLALDGNVRAEQEVFISYGSRSNDQLLQYYGFVEKDNPHDVYVMPPLRRWDIEALEKACGDPFAPGRLGKLERAGLLGLKAPGEASGQDDDPEGSGNPLGGVVVTAANGIDPAVMQALRALVSNEKEWIDAGEAVGNFAEQVNPDNEKRARTAARTALQIELDSKPTTVDEDASLLRDLLVSKKPETEDVLALQFRIEKKKLLQRAIDRLR